MLLKMSSMSLLAIVLSTAYVAIEINLGFRSEEAHFNNNGSSIGFDEAFFVRNNVTNTTDVIGASCALVVGALGDDSVPSIVNQTPLLGEKAASKPYTVCPKTSNPNTYPSFLSVSVSFSSSSFVCDSLRFTGYHQEVLAFDASKVVTERNVASLDDSSVIKTNNPFLLEFGTSFSTVEEFHYFDDFTRGEEASETVVKALAARKLVVAHSNARVDLERNRLLWLHTLPIALMRGLKVCDRVDAIKFDPVGKAHVCVSPVSTVEDYPDARFAMRLAADEDSSSSSEASFSSEASLPLKEGWFGLDWPLLGFVPCPAGGICRNGELVECRNKLFRRVDEEDLGGPRCIPTASYKSVLAAIKTEASASKQWCDPVRKMDYVVLKEKVSEEEDDGERVMEAFVLEDFRMRYDEQENIVRVRLPENLVAKLSTPCRIRNGCSFFVWNYPILSFVILFFVCAYSEFRLGFLRKSWKSASEKRKLRREERKRRQEERARGEREEDLARRVLSWKEDSHPISTVLTIDDLKADGCPLIECASEKERERVLELGGCVKFYGDLSARHGYKFLD